MNWPPNKSSATSNKIPSSRSGVLEPIVYSILILAESAIPVGTHDNAGATSRDLVYEVLFYVIVGYDADFVFVLNELRLAWPG